MNESHRARSARSASAHRIAITLIALLAFGPLAGCTEKESKSSDPGANSAANEPVKSAGSGAAATASSNGTTPPAAPSSGQPNATTSNPAPKEPISQGPASTEPGVVIGRVEGLDGPLAGLHVQLQGKELIPGKTDSAGEFVVSDVPPGDYVINVVDMPAVTSGLMRMKSRGTTVRPGEVTEENFELGFGFSVYGKISGVTGDPKRVLVSIFRDGAPELTGSPVGDKSLQYELAKYVEGSAFVNSDHSYEVIDIPTGTYELRVQVMPASGTSPSTPWAAPALRMTIEVEDQQLEIPLSI